MNVLKSKKTEVYHIPPLRLFWVVFGISALVQFIIITYNHTSGIVINQSIWHFGFRWGFSTLLTMFGFGLIIYPDLYMIRYLNRHFPWSNKILHRIALELALTVLLATFISSMVTTLSHIINAYEDGLVYNLVNNALITSVINILFTAGLEAWIFSRESRLNLERAEELEKELTGIRFEILKNQINPHFMFNSLNVLSGLIDNDTVKAQEFIDEFAMIYRYVLETIEKKVAFLRDELEFARSYMFLQQIRYGESLSYHIALDSNLLNRMLPPLSLQLVLENAIKHNIINEVHPLGIWIESENEYLVIRNSMQQKLSSRENTGIGQQNLIRRYRLISSEEPVFQIVDNNYLAKLPLIETT